MRDLFEMRAASARYKRGARMRSLQRPHGRSIGQKDNLTSKPLLKNDRRTTISRSRYDWPYFVVELHAYPVRAQGVTQSLKQNKHTVPYCVTPNNCERPGYRLQNKY